MIFGEHRYFLVNYPFLPNVAFTPEHNIHLTVEQAMMDFVDLIVYICTSLNIEDKAAIVFGGSYGGMLTAWLRMKFPKLSKVNLSLQLFPLLQRCTLSI